MKTLKVYDDAHQAVKIIAAKTGRTTTNVASSILRDFNRKIESGLIQIDAVPATECEEEETANAQ